MQINAIHTVPNKVKCPIGGAGIIGQMLQDATKDKINWVDHKTEQIKVGVVYQQNYWPWLKIPRISHVINEVLLKNSYIYTNYDVLVTVAEHTWKMFKQIRSNVELIENVARPLFVPGPKEIFREEPVLIYCGFLSTGKGIDKLIKAVKDIKCELWLIGQNNIANTHQKNVKFLGIKNEIEILKYLRSADIFILPSLSEGMSLALLEAMAVGLPCVVTNIPGNLDTCKNAAIYVESTVNSLRAGILKMIESKQLQTDLAGMSLQIAATRRYDIWGERFSELLMATAK